MALIEVRPQVDRQEQQNPLQESPHLRKKDKRKKIVAGVVLAAVLGFGGRVVMEEAGFSEQTVHAKPIASFETRYLKDDLQNILQKQGLVGDMSKPLPIEVVTFNTASGNPEIKTPQEEFVELPFYQKVINGAPDAPILGLQEAGPAQVEELEKYKDTGNFSYTYMKSQFSEGGNLLVVPKRFEMLESKNTIYSVTGQALGIIDSVTKKDFDASQVYPRMLTEAKLKDRFSGQEFTVFNTHLTFVDSIQYHQQKEIFKKIKERGTDAIILMGDLNADTGGDNLRGKRLKQHIEEVGLVDMEKSRDLGGKTDIDYILAKGFTSLKSDHLFKLSLPSSSTAEEVSDHYAESDIIQFNK